MCEPRYDVIEKAVVAMVKKEHGENVELLGEWESETDFAYYCWVEKLGHIVDYPGIVNWEKLFLELPRFGYVGKFVTARSGTNNDIICRVVYGFKIKG